MIKENDRDKFFRTFEPKENTLFKREKTIPRFSNPKIMDYVKHYIRKVKEIIKKKYSRTKYNSCKWPKQMPLEYRLKKTRKPASTQRIDDAFIKELEDKGMRIYYSRSNRGILSPKLNLMKREMLKQQSNLKIKSDKRKKI